MPENPISRGEFTAALERLHDKLDKVNENVAENRGLGRSRDDALARIERTLATNAENSEEFKKKINGAIEAQNEKLQGMEIHKWKTFAFLVLGSGATSEALRRLIDWLK